MEDQPSAPDSATAQIRRWQFMEELMRTPDIFYCEYQPFETLKIFHSGTCWVMELEATTTVSSES